MKEFKMAYDTMRCYREYLLSECLTFERFIGPAGMEIREGVVGLCARKIMLGLNESLIQKGILPYDESFKHRDEALPYRNDIWSMESTCGIESAIRSQVYGVMSALGWKIEEYEFTTIMADDGTDISEEYKNLLLEEGMDVYMVEELDEIGVFGDIDYYASNMSGDAKLTLYTNDRLSAALVKIKGKWREKLMNKAVFFSDMNMHTLTEKTSFWSEGKLYFLKLNQLIYILESGVVLDISDYYIDLFAPYAAMELNELLMEQELLFLNDNILRN